MQQHHINLSAEERIRLKKHSESEKDSMKSKRRAYILLDLDESQGKKPATIKSIAALHGVSSATVWKIRRQYVTEGMDSVLGIKNSETLPTPTKVTAHIIATCCSAPSEGNAVWTIQIMADKIVVDGTIDLIQTSVT